MTMTTVIWRWQKQQNEPSEWMLAVCMACVCLCACITHIGEQAHFESNNKHIVIYVLIPRGTQHTHTKSIFKFPPFYFSTATSSCTQLTAFCCCHDGCIIRFSFFLGCNDIASHMAVCNRLSCVYVSTLQIMLRQLNLFRVHFGIAFSSERMQGGMIQDSSFRSFA